MFRTMARPYIVFPCSVYSLCILILSSTYQRCGAAIDPSAVRAPPTAYGHDPSLAPVGQSQMTSPEEKFRNLTEELKSADTPQKREALFSPAAALMVEYHRHLDSRLHVLDLYEVDYWDEVLQKQLEEMSCVSMAVLDTPAMQATAVVFPGGFLGRISADLLSLGFFEACKGRVKPLAFHQHERAQDLPHTGAINDQGACEAAKTGGHHDPGFACGPTGGSDCRNLAHPPSSALRDTPFFTGTYVCNPEVYRLHPFACHAGDFSGKYGEGFDASVDPSKVDIRIITEDSHADNPCAAADREQSFVIHCHSTNKRIACAPFNRIEAGGSALSQNLHHLIDTLAVVISTTKHKAEEEPTPAEIPAPEQRLDSEVMVLAAEELATTDKEYLNMMATLVLIRHIEERVTAIEEAADRQNLAMSAN